MSLKRIFGLDRINKNILYYAGGNTLCGVGLGITITLFLKDILDRIVAAIIVFIIGFIIAQYYYNNILKEA